MTEEKEETKVEKTLRINREDKAAKLRKKKDLKEAEVWYTQVGDKILRKTKTKTGTSSWYVARASKNFDWIAKMKQEGKWK